MDLFWKILIILISAGIGLLHALSEGGEWFFVWVYPLIYFVVAILILTFLKILLNYPAKRILGGAVGFLAGVGIGYVIAIAFVRPYIKSEFTFTAIYFLIGYAGLRIGERKGPELFGTFLSMVSTSPGFLENYKILDTSVIIDGRIQDVVDSGFIEGVFITPQFVLNELQYVADSPDPIKRVRGRRGMEVLNRLQKSQGIEVRIVERDYPKIKDVDAKLIALTKDMGGKLVTTDYNLHKLAELQGVQVLNINQLATGLKPTLLPGEVLKVKVIKEGTEAGQGVGYLDDGTMIVVENGKRQMGKTIEVIITSVLQNPSGRIFFSKIKEETV
jgi:uncharacterized protein YacL